MAITAEYLAKGYEQLNGKLDIPNLEGGYSYPLSPTGQGNVLGAPPYHFCGEEMNIVYQADPEAVARFLPAPLEPSLENPGGVVLHMNSYISRIREDNLLLELPERCNYNETYLECRCRYQGKETKTYLYFWVDKDFSLLRGWLLGSPKKFGETHVSFEKRHMFELNPHFPQFDKGFEMGGVCSAHMEKLIYASCKLDKRIKAEELHPDILMPTNNRFIYPDIQIGYQGRAVDKMIHGVIDTWYGDVWQCSDPKIEFFDSVVEEHQLLRPVSIEASYFYQLGFTVYGHVVDRDLNEK